MVKTPRLLRRICKTSSDVLRKPIDVWRFRVEYLLALVTMPFPMPPMPNYSKMILSRRQASTHPSGSWSLAHTLLHIALLQERVTQVGKEGAQHMLGIPCLFYPPPPLRPISRHKKRIRRGKYIPCRVWIWRWVGRNLLRNEQRIYHKRMPQIEWTCEVTEKRKKKQEAR